MFISYVCHINFVLFKQYKHL